MLGLLAYVAVVERGAVLRAFHAVGRAGLAVAALMAISSGSFIVALNHASVAHILFMQALAPFLANGNPFRDLALFHRAEIEEGDPASRDRQALIFGFASSLYRDQAIDDEIEYLTRRADVNAFVAFSSRIHASAPTARRRDLDAHLVELFVQRGEAGNALQKGLALLRGGTLDDPADLVSRTLDHPELIRRMAADQQAMLGEADDKAGNTDLGADVAELREDSEGKMTNFHDVTQASIRFRRRGYGFYLAGLGEPCDVNK